MIWRSFLQVFSFSFHIHSGVFHKANIFILIRFNLRIFPFTTHALGVNSRTSLPSPRSWRSPSCFSVSFYSLSFTFKSISIWVKFCVKYEIWGEILFFCCFCYWNDYTSLNCFFTFVNNQLYIFVCLFLGFLFYSINLYVYSSNNITLSWLL